MKEYIILPAIALCMAFSFQAPASAQDSGALGADIKTCKKLKCAKGYGPTLINPCPDKNIKGVCWGCSSNTNE